MATGNIIPYIQQIGGVAVKVYPTNVWWFPSLVNGQRILPTLDVYHVCSEREWLEIRTFQQKQQNNILANSIKTHFSILQSIPVVHLVVPVDSRLSCEKKRKTMQRFPKRNIYIYIIYIQTHQNNKPPTQTTSIWWATDHHHIKQNDQQDPWPPIDLTQHQGALYPKDPLDRHVSPPQLHSLKLTVCTWK